MCFQGESTYEQIDGYNARPDLTLSMMRQNIKCYIYSYAKYVFFRQLIYSLKYHIKVSICHGMWGIEV